MLLDILGSCTLFWSVFPPSQRHQKWTWTWYESLSFFFLPQMPLLYVLNLLQPLSNFSQSLESLRCQRRGCSWDVLLSLVTASNNDNLIWHWISNLNYVTKSLYRVKRSVIKLSDKALKYTSFLRLPGNFCSKCWLRERRFHPEPQLQNRPRQVKRCRDTTEHRVKRRQQDCRAIAR